MSTYFVSTPGFKKFLYLINSAMRYHQPIAFFYDLSNVQKKNRSYIHKTLAKDYEKFYNVTFFSDFVPGFLTNPDGVSLFSDKPNFTFIVFLNYNFRSAHQNSLLNELNIFKYEYILISGNSVDCVALSPLLYLNIDLNNFLMLQVFHFYMFKYISFFIDPFKYNIEGNNKIQLLYNYNCFYLLVVMQHKKLLKMYYKSVIKKNIQNIKNINDLIKLLLVPRKIKTYFLMKYSNSCFSDILDKNHDLLRQVFLKRINTLFRYLKLKHKNIK